MLSLSSMTAKYLFGNAHAHILTFRLTLYHSPLPRAPSRSFIYELFYILPDIKMPEGNTSVQPRAAVFHDVFSQSKDYRLEIIYIFLIKSN